MSTIRRFLQDTRGNTGVAFAIAAIPVLAMAGAAIDYSQASSARQRLQNLADQAAINAVINTDLSDTQVDRLMASYNGTQASQTGSAAPTIDGGRNLTATVGSSDQSVTVRATEQMPTSLLGLVGIDNISLAVSSKAVRDDKGPPVCVLALNPTASSAVMFSGNASFTAEGCAVQSNSSASDALSIQGSSTVKAGGYCAYGGVSAPSTLDPKPKAGCMRKRDPFASLPQTTAGGCIGNNNKTYQVGSNKTETLRPGTYCGLDINGNATLSPGTYIIKDGAFSISSQATVKGDGVTIYLTGSGSSFTINGGGSISLTAPTSGTYQGMLIVQDRTSGSGNKINGNSSTKLVGAVYTPTRSLTVNGTSGFGTLSAFAPLVADIITFSGNSTTKADTTAMKTAEPLPTMGFAGRLIN